MQSRVRTVLLFVSAVVLVVTMASPSLAPPGDLDPTFDGDGKVITDFGEAEEANAVAIQPDRKIVAGGIVIDIAASSVGTDFAMARYQPDGSPDSSFDGDGRVRTDFNARDDRIFGIAIQDDGKIVAAGQATVFSFDFGLARYNPDGSLDSSFGDDGRVTTDFGTYDEARGLTIQEDGRIVVVGQAQTSSGESFALARYTPDGSLDTTFGGGDGIVTTEFGPDVDIGYSVALQLVTGSLQQNR